MENTDIHAIVRQAIQEFVSAEQSKSEPAYKTELLEVRPRRQQLERRLNEVVEEEQARPPAGAEEVGGAAPRPSAPSCSAWAFKKWIWHSRQFRIPSSAPMTEVSSARGEHGEVSAKDYLSSFVKENPEFLPARIAGGTGITATLKSPATGGEPITLDRIRPGMSAEEMQRVREEIVRVASQTLRGL